jgi:hypothetical protein
LTKDFNGEVIQEWNNLFLDLERYAQGFRPCPAPRALAYIGLACYEACVIDMPAFKSLRFNYPGLTVPTQEPLVDYHYPTVVNAIYSKLLTHFMGKYIDTRKQSQYKMWSERGEARYTEVFATHYENMLRAEFNLNLRSSYIYILFGNAYGLDEETSILNSDKRTSRYYPAYQDIQLNMDRDEEDPFKRAYLGNIQYCIK